MWSGGHAQCETGISLWKGFMLRSRLAEHFFWCQYGQKLLLPLLLLLFAYFVFNKVPNAIIKQNVISFWLDRLSFVELPHWFSALAMWICVSRPVWECNSWAIIWFLLVARAPTGSCSTRWERMAMVRDEPWAQLRPWAVRTFTAWAWENCKGHRCFWRM